MILALIFGAATGFFIALPPGPISVTIIRYGLAGDRSGGTKVALGAAILDMTCSLIAVFASTAIVASLKSLIDQHGSLVIVLQFACAVVLAVLGYKYIRAHAAKPGPLQSKTLKGTNRLRESSGFLIGIGIAFTGVITPTFFPSLIFITGYIHSMGWIGGSFADNVFFALGICAGAFLWLSILLRAVSHYRARLSDNFLGYIYKFAGGAFIVFAIILTYKVLTSQVFGTVSTDAVNLIIR